MRSTSATIRQRRTTEIAFRVFAILSLILIIGPAVWLIAGVLGRALPHWKWSVLWTALSVAQ
ncbi:MAG TPA: hypothetical protein VNG12_02555, partial [Acidimicrobiales bacterium]|nr:hypothetical protein [Acidimicrobiales bacterium]